MAVFDAIFAAVEGTTETSIKEHPLPASAAEFGAGGLTETDPPTITGVTPAGGTELLTAKTPIQFTVSDTGSGLKTVLVFIQISGENHPCLIYDGISYLGIYATTSTVSGDLTSGLNFSVLPNGGWTKDFTLRVFAGDTVGNVDPF